MITVKPWVELDGNAVSCKVDELGTRPIVMDGLTVRWGREGYFDEAEPSRCTVRLWDSSAEWAERIRDSRALGVELAVKWSTGSRTVTMFRGSVANAHADELDRTDDRGNTVWEVTLTASDPTAALGNVFPVPGTLSSSHTMEDRKAWLMGLAEYGGIRIADLEYQQGYRTARCKPVDVGKDSALDLLGEFYGSMSGDAFSYDPDTNRVVQAERMDWEFHTYLASFDDSRGAVMVTATDAEINGRTRPGVALSACTLGVPEGISIAASTDTDINAVESTWSDPLDEWKDKVAFRESVQPGSPRRMFKNETWMTTDWAIELQLDSAWDRARAEGRRPRHPNLYYRPGSQFATERLARWWLQPWEDARPAFINGDAAHSWLMSGAAGWPPLLSPLGGTIRYDGDTGWELDLTPQWMRNRISVTPMTWGKLQQIKWSSQSEDVPWWWGIIGLPKPPPKQVGTPTPNVTFGGVPPRVLPASTGSMNR